MPAQQHMFAETPPADARSKPGRPPVEPTPAPVWLQRMSLIVLVIFCFYVGGLVVWLPWSTHYWEQNGWLMGHPTFDIFLQRGWVRGLVSGIGLLDIWIGISEMVHYRDYRT